MEFSQVGAGFADGLIIGRFLGSAAMAAEGIVHPIYSISGILSGILATGMQVRCSQAIGRGNHKEFCSYVSIASIAGIITALCLSGAVIIFSQPITVALGASGNAAHLSSLASSYLTGLGIGIPSLIMTAILAPAISLDSGNKTIQIGALIETITNILLDLLAVKLDMGLFGIGLATSIASYTNLIFQCSFFLKKDRILHFVKPDISVKDFFRMLGNGSEKATRRLANTIRPVVLNSIIISSGGVAAMSSLAVRNNLANFVEIIPSGIAYAVSLLSGVFIGEINEKGVKKVGSFAHKMIGIVSCLACILMFILARPIAGLYITDDNEALSLTAFVIRMLALQNPLQALILSRIKYLQAVRKNTNVNILTVATQFVFVLICALTLGKLFGVYGILACFTVSDALTLLSIYIFYAVKSRKIIPGVSDYLGLSEEFHISPKDVISLDIRDKNEVSLASEQIMLFANGHQINRKTSFFAALCFEELAMEIINKGFDSVRKNNPMIDLRVVITEDTFVIKLRDNCPKYDITRQIAKANEEGTDHVSSIGIRIVSRTASDISYLRTFDTNSIIIRFNISAMETSKQ